MQQMQVFIYCKITSNFAANKYLHTVASCLILLVKGIRVTHREWIEGDSGILDFDNKRNFTYRRFFPDRR